MDLVDPRIPAYLLPLGSKNFILGSEQNTYIPLPAIITPEYHVITRWSPNLAERSAIVRGDDIYVTMIAINRPGIGINPFKVRIGLEEGWIAK